MFRPGSRRSSAWRSPSRSSSMLGIEQHYIDTDADIGKITPAIEKAFATSRPVAFLIGRKPL